MGGSRDVQIKFVIVMPHEAARLRCRMTASQLISSLRMGPQRPCAGFVHEATYLPLWCVGMATTHDDGLSK